MDESRQLSLLGIEPRPLPRAEPEDAPADVADSPQRTEAPSPGQIDLFADYACVSRDLDAALRDGDFTEANRLRRLIEETYGGSAESRALILLEEQEHPLMLARPEEALSAWRIVDSSLDRHPRLRRLLREGAFRRLLDRHSAEEVAARVPDALPALALTLASSATGSGDDERRRAFGLVRNALVAGQSLDPFDFRWDQALADLLAEDEAPVWLACLGAIRRLWPTGRLTSGQATQLSPFENPQPPDEAARAFWSCLCAVQDTGCPEDVLHAARRRMKELRPDFHSIYMRRART